MYSYCLSIFKPHIIEYFGIFWIDIHRRKFRSQTSDNMDRWKAEQGRGREKRKIRREKSQKRKSQKKEDTDARKGRKVAIHCVFPMICGSGGSKSRLAKAAGAEPAGQMRDEKLHAVVARSTLRSQNVQNTTCSRHFWKVAMSKKCTPLWCEAHSKSKCTKHTILGPLLEVQMSKKCTPLWREAHFQVKMYKAHQCRTTFGSCNVEKVHAVVARSTFQVKVHKTHHSRTTFGSSDVEKVHAVVAQSTFPSQNVENTTCSGHFWRFGCWKSARRCGAKHIAKSKCTKHAVVARSTFANQNVQNTTCSRHFWRFGCRKSVRRCGAKHIWKSKRTKHTRSGPFLEVQMSLRFKTLHYRTLHYSTLQYTTLHYITVQYTPLH